MAVVQQRVIIGRRYEFILPGPTNGAELGKAFAVAQQVAESQKVDTGFDDWLTVEGRDTDVVLHFTTERPE